MTGHRQPAMTASRIQRFCRTFSTLLILTASATTKAYCRPAPPILLDGAKLLFFWAIRCRSAQTI